MTKTFPDESVAIPDGLESGWVPSPVESIIWVMVEAKAGCKDCEMEIVPTRKTATISNPKSLKLLTNTTPVFKTSTNI